MTAKHNKNKQLKKRNTISDEKQTFWLVLGKILALIATFAVPLFLTRFLDKEQYGFYTQFNTVLYFFVLFFSFGITTNLYYFFPTIKKNKKRAVIFQTVIFLLLFSLLSALFIYIPFFNSFFLGNESLMKYKLVLYLLTIILVFISIMDPLYVIKKDANTSIWFPAIQVLLKALSIIIFFLFIPTIQSIINAIIFSSILVFLIVLKYVSKTIKELPEGELLIRNVAFNQLKYNLPIGASIAIKAFSQRFDKLISISFLSTSAFASYSIAFFGIPGINQIYSSISQVTVINMTTSFSLGDKKTALMYYKAMVVKTLSFSVPIILIVSLYAEQIIVILFTEKYKDATPLFQMYLMSFFFIMIGSGLILRSCGKTKYSMYAFVFASFITIPSTYFLVKNYGSFGAMCGALLSIILPKFYQIKKEIEFTDSTFRTFLPWKEIGFIFLVSFVSILPFILIKHFTSNHILNVILNIMVYVIIVYSLEIKLNIFIIENEKLKGLRMKYLKF